MRYLRVTADRLGAAVEVRRKPTQYTTTNKIVRRLEASQERGMLTSPASNAADRFKRVNNAAYHLEPSGLRFP